MEKVFCPACYGVKFAGHQDCEWARPKLIVTLSTCEGCKLPIGECLCTVDLTASLQELAFQLKEVQDKAIGADNVTTVDLLHWVGLANAALTNGLEADPIDDDDNSTGPINGARWSGNTLVNDAGEPMGTCRGY